MRQDLTDICSKKHDIDFLITFRNTLKQDLEVEYLNRRIRSLHTKILPQKHLMAIYEIKDKLNDVKSLRKFKKELDTYKIKFDSGGSSRGYYGRWYKQDFRDFINAVTPNENWDKEDIEKHLKPYEEIISQGFDIKQYPKTLHPLEVVVDRSRHGTMFSLLGQNIDYDFFPRFVVYWKSSYLYQNQDRNDYHYEDSVDTDYYTQERYNNFSSEGEVTLEDINEWHEENKVFIKVVKQFCDTDSAKVYQTHPLGNSKYVWNDKFKTLDIK